jgi:hypothetical protein
MSMPSSTAVRTLGQELSALLGLEWRNPSFFEWPPDGFAVCGWLLECSGAYACVLKDWPPRSLCLEDWKCEIAEAATAIRSNIHGFLKGQPSQIPSFVGDAWSTLCRYEEARLDSLPAEAGSILLELLAVTDESCVGFGLPEAETFRQGRVSDQRTDEVFGKLRLLEYVQLKLQEWLTLTPRFPLTMLSVLPKQHTPKSGITLRSLTHHLALFTGGEVVSKWLAPTQSVESRLNLLVIPWPFAVSPSQFRESHCPAVKFADGFGCFDYESSSFNESIGHSGAGGPQFEQWLAEIFKASQRQHGKIDGVVMPESALSPGEFEVLDRVAKEFGAFLVAGVGSPPSPSCTSQKNEVWMTFGVDENRIDRVIRQSKHHRWKLDKDQILMYGLAGSLDPNKAWWENIDIGRRELHFVSMGPQLTVCCLICEDLARQDPVANLVRSVGPNLVIAVLSDGPQLSKRWSARYATVLADDPGSSVLTVTGLGMTRLSEPPPGEKKSRVIALWKDSLNGSREISVDEGCAAVMLNLWLTSMTECSADGRDDGGVASVPALGGVHQVPLPRLAQI